MEILLILEEKIMEAHKKKVWDDLKKKQNDSSEK